MSSVEKLRKLVTTIRSSKPGYGCKCTFTASATAHIHDSSPFTSFHLCVYIYWIKQIPKNLNSPSFLPSSSLLSSLSVSMATSDFLFSVTSCLGASFLGNKGVQLPSFCKATSLQELLCKTS